MKVKGKMESQYLTVNSPDWINKFVAVQKAFNIFEGKFKKL